MKHHVSFVVFFMAFLAYGQNYRLDKIGVIPLKSDRFIGVDSYGSYYYLDDGVFYKRMRDQLYNYYNVQLGTPTDIDILDPLGITLFYRDYNTVVQLDNTLNESNLVNFNSFNVFREVIHATTAINKNLWVFDQINQQLETFNYQTQRFLAINNPIQDPVLVQRSNYNFCWLLTEKTLYQFNIYGSLVTTLPNEEYDNFIQSNGRLLFKKGAHLHYLPKNSLDLTKLPLVEIEVQQLSLSGESLYIYDGEFVHHFAIILTKP